MLFAALDSRPTEKLSFSRAAVAGAGSCPIRREAIHIANTPVCNPDSVSPGSVRGEGKRRIRGTFTGEFRMSADRRLNVGKAESQPKREAKASPKLHRLASVRRSQGHSVQSLARRLGCTEARVIAMEDETRDPKISELLDWQQALDVPLDDLLVEPGIDLTITTRARLVLVMKTVAAIQESKLAGAAGEFANRLANDLVELMPELKHVRAWHNISQRNPDDLGRAASRIISDDVLAPPR